jgi:methionyl-tRNA formyltransferase
MRDFITGGTVYWLNAGIDRGDIERQREVWIDPKYFSMPPKDAAAELWRSEIAPLGVELMREAPSRI